MSAGLTEQGLHDKPKIIDDRNSLGRSRLGLRALSFSKMSILVFERQIKRP